MKTEKVNQNLLNEWQRKDAEHRKNYCGYSLMDECAKFKEELPVMTDEQKKKNELKFWKNKEESERTNLKLQVEFADFLSKRIYGYISCPHWWHEMRYRNIMKGEK